MLKKSFLALSAEAKGKKPQHPAPAKPTPDKKLSKSVPLAPKAPAKRTVFDKPDPIKPDTRPPVNPEDSLSPEDKATIKRPVGSTNRILTPPVRKVAPKPATSYPDLFNGGKTGMSPKRQVQVIKDTQSGKLSERQYRLALNVAAQGHYVVTAKALTDLGIPLGNEHAKATAEQIIAMPKLKRTNALAGIPEIHNFHLFANDPAARKRFLDTANLPANASDRQIIEAIGALSDKKATGWEKLNPFHGGVSHIADNVGENYVHPAFRDFVETPAKLGAGLAATNLAAARSAGNVSNDALNGGGFNFGKDISPLTETAAEGVTGTKGAAKGVQDMLRHPGAALQNDPIGTAVTVATLGDSAAAKLRPLASAERVLKAEDLAGKSGKALTISKGPASAKPLTRFIQRKMDELLPDTVLGTAVPGGVTATLKKHVKRDKRVAANAGEADVNHLFDAMHRTAVQHRISIPRQTEILHTHGQGVTHGQMTDFFQTQHDHISEVLAQDDKLRADKAAEGLGEKARPQHRGELNDLADHYDEQAQLQEAKSEAAQERLTSKTRSKATRSRLAKVITQAEAEAKRLRAQAARTREDAKTAPMDRVRLLTKNERRNLGRIQDNLKSHIKWHDRPDTPLTPGEQDWLDKARAVSNHRTDLMDQHGLPENSSIYRDNETAIQVAAHDGSNVLHGIADHIMQVRDETATIREQYPGIDKVDIESITPNSRLYEPKMELDHLDQQLNESLHNFTEANPGSFRVGREAPRQRNMFTGRTGNISPRTDFFPMARKGQRSTGVQLRSGQFVPSIAPMLADTVKASRAAASVDWVHQVLGNGDHGVVRVPKPAAGEEVRVGDLVQHPENFVLRSVTNLRKAVDSRAGIDDALSTLTEADGGVLPDVKGKKASALEDAYHESLINPNLTPDTYIPSGDGNYVLVPKAVDEALVGGLTHKPAPDIFNKAYRANVLYSRPGFAFRNVTQAITTNAIGGVGPGAYLKALRKDEPVAPGVENHGLAGAASRGDFEESRSAVNLIRDVRFADRSISGKGVGKAAAKLPVESIRVLTDSVKHMNRIFENFARRAAYHHFAGKEASATVKRIDEGMSSVGTDLQSVLDHFADPRKLDNPVARKEAQAAANRIVDKVHELQGDYVGMPDFQRAQLFVPFYRWYLFIGNLMLKMPFKYPVANQFVQGLGAIGDQARRNLGQDLNDGNRSDTNIPIPGLSPNLTKATTGNVEYVNPFTSGVDIVNHPESLAPLVSQMADLLRGRDTYGNELKDQNNHSLTLEGSVAHTLQSLGNLFAPAKIIEGRVHPGPRSPNSLPFPLSLVPGGTHHKYQSADAKHAELFPSTRKPTDTPLEDLLNWLTGAGIHEKNLTEEEYQAQARAYKTMRANQK